MRISGRRYSRAVALGALAIFLLLPAAALEARVIAPEEARLAAARLLEMENAHPGQRLTPGTFRLASLEPLTLRERQVAYLARFTPGGFMVLSDVTEVTPQVFVSFSADFESVRDHPYFSRILDRLEYDKVHLHYLDEKFSRPGSGGPGERADAIQVSRNERDWDLILDPGNALPAGRGTEASERASEVAPLLTTSWDQDAPFWNDTPRVGGQATYTGCSATAMAQVMFYWKHPDRGQGSHSYFWGGQTLSANFDHPYDWGLMLEDYSEGYTEAQAEAVARLMSDVGIAIDMNYGVTGSGAFPNDNDAFPEFFKYSPDAHDVYRADLPGWDAYFEVIRAQLDLHQPVILAIYNENSGHAVVADGYRTAPGNQAHINMGWSGSADAYYTLSNIYGYGDADWDYAVIDIHPARFKLTVKTTAGGTTDPPPGVYPFPYGTAQVMRLTARPDAHYAFIGWTGHATGLDIAVDVVVDKEKTITANFQRIIYAPLNAAGQRIVNRSFSQQEIVNVLAFEGHPDNIDIMGYRIYQEDGGTWKQSAFLTGGAGSFQYLHRGVSADTAYAYRVVALNFSYREGAPALVEIR